MSIYKIKDYDKNKDYTEEINKAVKTGDYSLAGSLEKKRNNKIAGEGLSYPKTYNYIDVGNEIKAGIQNGADADYIYELMRARENKAKTTPKYSQYANDELQDAAAQYYYSKSAGDKPEYKSRYGDKLDEMLDRVMNGERFSYDAASDPLYQQYKKQYTREGQRAYKDTLASLAAGAGGENSWAASAASQANNYYMQQLADKVPELYSLAYDKYLAEQSADMNKLAQLRDLENTDYNKYLNEMSIYQNDRDYYNQQYNTWKNNQYTDKQWEYQTANDMLENYISAGVMPPENVLLKAGISDKGYVSELVEKVKRNNEYENKLQDYTLEGTALDNEGRRISNEGGRISNNAASRQLDLLGYGTSGKSTTKKSSSESGKTDGGNIDDAYIDTESLEKLGLGNLSYEEIEEMVEDGRLRAIQKNGKIVLTKGLAKAGVERFFS